MGFLVWRAVEKGTVKNRPARVHSPLVFMYSSYGAIDGADGPVVGVALKVFPKPVDGYQTPTRSLRSLMPFTAVPFGELGRPICVKVPFE